MIYDTLDNANQYTGLFENLDTALEFLDNTDLSDLPLGRTDIDGDNVYALVSETDAVKSDDKDFELHSRYMDIHIDLEGCEIIEFALGSLTEKAPYDESQDFALFAADLSCACVMGEGRFCVCMTEEPHKPLVAAAGTEKLKKCVIKVKRD